MDNIRLILWISLVVLVWTAFQAWQLDYGYTPPQISPAAPAELPAAPASDLPELPQPPQAPAAQAAAPLAPAETAARVEPVQLVPIRTDVLDLLLDLRGGDLRSASLPGYPVHKDRPDQPVELLSPDPGRLFHFRTGLRAAGGQQPEPNHQATYTTAQPEYDLGSADTLEVVLRWENAGPVSVEKVYRFRRGRYDIELEYLLRNEGAEPYQVASYLQIQRLHQPPERSYFNVDSYSFTGPVIYDGDKYEKLDVEDLVAEPFKQQLPRGWIASIQHHFLAAAVPPAAEVFSYDVTVSRDIYTLSAIGPLVAVPVAGEQRIGATLFVGPKLQAQLTEVADDLALTVDYGILTILAQPLFWVLQKIHDVVGNWGWAIIIATFLIKLVFYKLTETSGRSMAKMRGLQPRMKALQERYKDDRQAMSQALMELYKREKVNPAAGCLPMVVQIPFFIAFYWVLLESVEMRQAPFALWINDLSSRDPFFILPILMGVAMYLQTSLNPAPPDPMQAKIMKFMPIMFTAMFAFFPAGLVLYWFTNSLLSILQQWNINRKLKVS